MRPRSLLILALLVAGLLAFIWFFERELPSTEKRAELAKRVLSLESDQVSEVVVERGGSALRLARSAATGEEEGNGESDWRLVEPLAARADGSAVGRLVDTLVELEKERTLEDADAAAVGLESPRATVTLVTAAGEERLLVGSEIPASNNMVVQRQGEAEFHVVSGSVWSDLDKEAGEWRSRDVLPAGRDEIERVVLRRGGERPDLVLARRGREFWLESPITDRADKDRVGGLLDEITRLRVEEFVDEAEESAAEMGLEPPRAELLVTLKGEGETFHLTLGAPAAEDGDEDGGLRYARAEAQTFRIRNDLDEALERSAVDWQSPAWTDREVYEIERLRIADAEGELELERSGADWARGEETISYSPVSDFLYALTGAAAERVVDRQEAAGLEVDADTSTLELTLAGKESEQLLALHPPVGELVPATCSGREHLLLLPAATVEDLKLKLAEIRAAEPLEEEEGPPEGG